MSSTDVQNVRDWRKETTDATPLEQNLDPVTILASGAEDSNLDWLDKRVNNDPPSPSAGTGAGQTSREEAIQFKTRKQNLERSASAAGARRSDNDADLLGFTTPARKGAARKVLGV